MSLRDDFSKQGNWLFRWRSYIPVIILPLILVALRNGEYFEKAFGETGEAVWEIFCFLLSFSGLVIRCLVVGYAPKRTSGRNTKKQVADVLNTTGMYSLVRNPLYLGNFLIFIGIVLFPGELWLGVITTLSFWLYYERIIFAEEEFLRLKFDDNFLEWSNKTPAFIPNFRGWHQPLLQFSFRNVLRREYTALYIITFSFPAIDVLADLISEGKIEIDLSWGIIFLLGTIAYVTLRFLKRNTSYLDVKGR